MNQATAAVVAGCALGHATTAALAAKGLTVALYRNEHAMSDLPDAVHAEAADPRRGDTAHRPGDGRGRTSQRAGERSRGFRLGDGLATTLETLRLMFAVNIGPGLWLSQAVAPHMQRQGSGAIVHVTARARLEPASGMAAYSVSKAALVHLTCTLDLELRPYGIR